MKTQMATLALGLAALAGAAPAHANAARRLPPASTADTAVYTVTVQNNRKVPVTIYMEHGAFDRRLGIVPAMQTKTLRLPQWAVERRESIQLFAHPAGDVIDLATQDFSLKPPARLAMVVPRSGDMRPTPTDGVSGMMATIPSEELAHATLTVDNPRGKPVTVLAQQGDIDVRLGVVPARGHATFRFPKSVVLPDETIQVFVEPENGFDLATQTLHVRPGEHLGLRVPLH
jgi:hypothetical protein